MRGIGYICLLAIFDSFRNVNGRFSVFCLYHFMDMNISAIFLTTGGRAPGNTSVFKKDEIAVSPSFNNCFISAKYEVEEQSTLLIVCKQTGKHLYDPPIWEINKISSETSDKLECGKFETKRGGGVLWGLGGGEGAGSGNGRNERFCTLHHLYNTINFSCLHNAGKSLQTTPAPCSTCSSLCRVVYCWLGLP